MTARGFLRHRRDCRSARQVLERLGVRTSCCPIPRTCRCRQALARRPCRWTELSSEAEAASAPGAPDRGLPASAPRGRQCAASAARRHARGRAGPAPPRLRLRHRRARRGNLGRPGDGAAGRRAQARTGTAGGCGTPRRGLGSRARAALAGTRGVARLAGGSDIAGTLADRRGAGVRAGPVRRLRGPHAAPAAAGFAAAPASGSATGCGSCCTSCARRSARSRGCAELISSSCSPGSQRIPRACGRRGGRRGALLAGFDEIDRLARLESGAPVLDPGQMPLGRSGDDMLRRIAGAAPAQRAHRPRRARR